MSEAESDLNNPSEQVDIPVITIPAIANDPRWTGQLSSEDPTERQHRLDQEAADNWHKRFRTSILFGFTLIVIGVVLGLAVAAIINPNVSKDDKKWATTIVGSITTGLIGFATGKATS